MDLDLTSVKVAFDYLRSAISLVKDVNNALPDSAETKTLSKVLENADRASILAEAEVAKSLGYHLCQCSFPPQIMLSIGQRAVKSSGHIKEFFQCPKCNKEYPIEQPSSGAASFGNDGSDSWMR